MQESQFEAHARMLEGHWKGNGEVMVHGKRIPYLEDSLFKVLRQAPAIVINV